MYAIRWAGKSTMPLNSLASCVSLKRKTKQRWQWRWKLLKATSPGILSHDCATLALLDTFPKAATLSKPFWGFSSSWNLYCGRFKKKSTPNPDDNYYKSLSAVCTLWLFHLVTWLEIDKTKQLRVQILQFCIALGTDWQTSRVCFSQNRFSVVLAFLPSLALLCYYGSRPFFSLFARRTWIRKNNVTVLQFTLGRGQRK